MISERITARGISLRGFFASAANAVDDSKPTRIRMAIVDWNNMPAKLCGRVMEEAVGWYQPSGETPSGFCVRNIIAKMEKTTNAKSWITLIAMDAVVEPVMPRMAI